MGVCLARQGVTELGHLITTKLLAKQVPAVLASPFAIGANHAGTTNFFCADAVQVFLNL